MFARLLNRSRTPILALIKGRTRGKVSPVELPDVMVYRSGNIIYVEGW